MSDYAHSGASPVTESVIDPFAYGRGFIETLAQQNPSAGAGFSQQVDGRYVSRLIALTFQLVTSAVVASRFVTVDLMDGNGLTIVSRGPSVAILAGSTQKFTADMWRSGSEWNTGSTVFFGLTEMFLEPGRLVQINVANIDVTDQLSKIVLTFDRFPSGPRGYPEGAVGHGARGRQLHRPSHVARRP